MRAPSIPVLLAIFSIARAAVSSGSEQGIAFDPILARQDLWSLSQDAFQEATQGMPFRWTSSARDSARAASREEMQLFGRPIYEFIARFDGGKLGMVTANFYARGDAGDLNENQFKTLLISTVEALTKATGVKHTVRGRDGTNAVGAEGLVWQTPTSQFLLEYSFTRAARNRSVPFRAEFVRLEVRPLGKRVTMLTTASLTRPRFNAAQHIRREATGDVWLHDVPMVDQGQKGYCVVASAERIMRYYGSNMDANELAQIANSDAQGGTSLNAMTESLRKVAARLKVRVREHEKLGMKGMLDLMRDYNRAAKRANESEIYPGGGIIDVAQVYATMKPQVLKEARTKNPGDVTRFLRAVQSSIDSGIPMLWSVQLGIVPEPGLPQVNGGHMRLIIGYNARTQDVIYSDSWGAGHERKRMKLEDAWTITTSLTTIEPS